MIKCEFCGKNDDIRYTQFGVSILGADVCLSCEKVVRSMDFKYELFKLLKGQNGNLDKFYKKHIKP